MTLREAVAALVVAAPPDANVPVRWLAELLAAEGSEAAVGTTVPTPAAVDLTVAEVAALFHKGPSTIRTWLARGEFPGAYRLHGGEWRVPPAAVEAMQRNQATQHAATLTPRRTSAPADTHDLAAWRKVKGGASA